MSRFRQLILEYIEHEVKNTFIPKDYLNNLKPHLNNSQALKELKNLIEWLSTYNHDRAKSLCKNFQILYNDLDLKINTLQTIDADDDVYPAIENFIKTTYSLKPLLDHEEKCFNQKRKNNK